MAGKTKSTMGKAAGRAAGRAGRSAARYVWQGRESGGVKAGLFWLGGQMRTPFDPAKRREWLLRRKASAQRKRRWVNVDGGVKGSSRSTPVFPSTVRSGWGCTRCGWGGSLADKKDHRCDPAMVKTKKGEDTLRTRATKVRKLGERTGASPASQQPVTPSRRGHKVVKTTKGQPRPRPRTAPAPAAGPTPTRGARIVRANTAAERFALIAVAEPQTSHEVEQLVNDITQGFLRLSEELMDLAETRLDLDPKVIDKVVQLSEYTADLMEPARNIRWVFRSVYAAQLENPVYLPRNASTFFGQTA